MKRRNKYKIIIAMIIIALSGYSVVHGQPPLPGGHGQNGNQGAGGAAPVDGGSLMLILSGLSYGTMKVIRAYKGKKDVL
jgi:hypothetical protein